MPLYREATHDDLGPICVLGEAVNALHHEAWPHVFAAGGDPKRHADHWQQSIGTEKATAFVCEHEASIVGFVTVAVTQDQHSLLRAEPYGRVGSVCVAETHRGRGIGRALMLQAEQWAQARGASDIRLTVWRFNERALRLYAELGYDMRSHQLGKRLPRSDA
jgi:ribosomal protein S18 acetylase RimI-like enzyme